MTITVRSRKAKARALQNWIAQRISDITGIPWGKDQLIASREMGQKGPDVRLIGRARELFPFTIEAKNQERWSVMPAVKEAVANLYPNTNWLVFLKRNRVRPLVVMDGDMFFNLIQTMILERCSKE